MKKSDQKNRGRTITGRIGGLLLLAGVLCIVIKGFTPEYVDAQGVLHEAFFLLPMGFLAMALGCALLLAVALWALIARGREKQGA